MRGACRGMSWRASLLAYDLFKRHMWFGSHLRLISFFLLTESDVASVVTGYGRYFGCFSCSCHSNIWSSRALVIVIPRDRQTINIPAGCSTHQNPRARGAFSMPSLHSYNVS